MSAPALELRDVWLSLGGRPLLEGVDLRVEPRDYLAILGPNGCGKTTLLRVLLGLIAPDRGEVRVLDGPPVRARGRVGYVPQHAGFDRDFPIRVRDVVRMGCLGARGVRRPGAEARQRVAELLARLEIADCARLPIGALSGGQLQRVLIARALALEPEILILDEPTASLDERVERGVWELLAELSERMTVVVVSHDIGAIATQVRSVACLNRVLHRHRPGELTAEVLEATYGAPVVPVVHDHGPPRGDR